MRNQIRIAQTAPHADGRAAFGATEWMEASSSNRWLLRMRLTEALEAHGTASHRLETRPATVDPRAAQGGTGSADESISAAARNRSGWSADARLSVASGRSWSRA
jgi:hypothetical protein